MNLISILYSKIHSELKNSYNFQMRNSNKPHLRRNAIKCFIVYAILFTIQSLPFFPEIALYTYGTLLGIYALILSALFGYLGLVNAIFFNPLGAIMIAVDWMYRRGTPDTPEPYVYFVIFSFLLFVAVGAAIIAELSERGRKKEQQLEWLSIVDGLTEVYNHRFFQQRLDEEVARAERNGSSLALLMIDIDNFKSYNDNYGHRAGDRFLKRCSDYFKRSLRNNDVVCRYGGDEFVIIMPDTDIGEAGVAAARLNENFHREVVKAEIQEPTNLSISIGFSAYPEPSVGRDKLIADADSALYQSKNLGMQKKIDLSRIYHDSKIDSSAVTQA